MFRLDPRLEADTIPLGGFELCRVLLSRNAAWPWLILVPEIADISEVTALSESNQQKLWQEVAAASRALQQVTAAHKMNIATLGNIVRQLHVHVVARFEADPAWPGPIWGSGYSAVRDEAAQTDLITTLRPRLWPAS
jgi:diadenosine tetraphosphate (Ap4A) HIT family hydrolase